MTAPKPPSPPPLNPSEWLQMLRHEVAARPNTPARVQAVLYQRPPHTSFQSDVVMLGSIFAFLAEHCPPADMSFFCKTDGFLNYLDRINPHGFFHALKSPPSAEPLFAFLNAITDRDLKHEYARELLIRSLNHFDPAVTKALLKHDAITQTIIIDLLALVDSWPLNVKNRDTLCDILSVARFEKDPHVIKSQKAARAFTPKPFILKRK
jgi:hypothetical protein